MNIFATSEDPVRCAKALDNKRVVKMVLESTQILCTAIIINGGEAPYKPAHVRHPCTIWASESISNWMWLYHHAYTLCQEYTRRYHKVHKCQGILDTILSNSTLIPDGHLTAFANCTRNLEHNIDFRDLDNTHKAYRLYLKNRWFHDKQTPSWKVK